ncbi:cupin domain-containing protein [Candidatus Gracilibacteria bacterium]|nr:cupin domain-containing protein [Candidatus Gracilibacteria bacterium]
MSDPTIKGRWTAITFLQTARDTDGTLLQFDQTLEVGAPATVYHRHQRQAERFVVLAGAMGLRLEGAEYTLGPGEEATVSAGQAHAMWNAGDTTLVTRIELTPALASETFFRTIIALERDGKFPRQGAPNPLRMALILPAYEVELAALSRPLQYVLFAPLAVLGRLLGFRASYLGYNQSAETNPAMTDSFVMHDKKQERRARQHAAVRDEIKDKAREHMARDGAAALSLRAVAGDLGLSSAAIYYYYPNRDALITDLIVDGYRAMGAAMREIDRHDADIAERLLTLMHAYRNWALAHAAEYALLFGTPIPGYHAPAEITSPEARSVFSIISGLFAVAYAQGRLRAGDTAPPTISAHVAQWLVETGQEVPLPVLLATIHAWAMGHGLIGLELDHHLQPVIGDVDALFAYEVNALLRQFGLVTS